MAQRRSLDEPPGTEIKDFVEYAELYRLAWSDEVIRWVLSTVPSAMIFDDHDIRDDWNTSWSWRRRSGRRPGGRSASSGAVLYWVHQHIGNLSPAELAEEEVWRVVAAHAASGATEEARAERALDALATRAMPSRPPTAGATPARSATARSSSSTRVRRANSPDGRSMLDAEEMAWLDGILRGGVRHVFVGTSPPFLLPPGLHDFEAMNEAMAQGAYGAGSRSAELRRSIDLEHWAAFNEGFDEVFDLVMEVARGERKPGARHDHLPPGTCTTPTWPRWPAPARLGARSRIVQAVCSPIRNPMPRGVRVVMSLSRGRSCARCTVASRSRRAPTRPTPGR